MVVFTTLDHLERRGTTWRLARRYGEAYRLVLIDCRTTEEIREILRPTSSRRLLATIVSRNDIVAWLRHYDTPGEPWPKYAIEGL